MITVSESWLTGFPEAFFGVLVMEGVDNSRPCKELENRKTALEAELRQRHLGKNRKDIACEQPFALYENYYRRFDKGYPVLHQVETVALKGKPVISPSPLVAAMFMAELKNGLLTAGHDLDLVSTPLVLGSANGRETYLDMAKRERTLKSGDMFLSDKGGVISSVIYGPDDHSCITPGTTRVLFTTYGAPSLESGKLLDHLKEIEEMVLAISPGAITKELSVLP